MGMFSNLCSSVKSAVKSKASSALSSVKDSVKSGASGGFGEFKKAGASLFTGDMDGFNTNISALGGRLGGYASAAKGLYDKASPVLGAISGIAGIKSLFGGGDSKDGKKKGKGGKKDEDKDGKDSKTYVFSVEIDGIECASFHDCSGLSVHTDVIEVAEGGENTTTRKFYGNTHYDNVRLSNGVSEKDNALLKWLQSTTSSNSVEKKSASLIMKSLSDKEVKRWNIFGAMPVKWDLPTNNKEKAGKNSAVIIENIEFAIDRFEIDA